jgi:hypothetical protein
VVLFPELTRLGYSSGLTTLKLHLVAFKPMSKAEPLIHFETEAGRQMQADFASIGAESITFRCSLPR